MRKILARWCAVVLCASAGAAAPCHARDAADGLTMTRQASGVEYYVSGLAGSGRSMQVRIILRGGAAEEADDEKGYAHLLEHVLMRNRLRRGGSITAALLDAGLQPGRDFNGTTNADAVIFNLVLAGDAAGRSFVADDIVPALLDCEGFGQSELEAEQRVVLEELRLRAARGPSVRRQIEALLRGEGQAVAADPGGVAGTVARATVDRLRGFCRRTVRPERTVVAVVGTDVPADFGIDGATIPVPRPRADADDAPALPATRSVVSAINDRLAFRAVVAVRLAGPVRPADDAGHLWSREIQAAAWSARLGAYCGVSRTIAACSATFERMDGVDASAAEYLQIAADTFTPPGAASMAELMDIARQVFAAPLTQVELRTAEQKWRRAATRALAEMRPATMAQYADDLVDCVLATGPCTTPRERLAAASTPDGGAGIAFDETDVVVLLPPGATIGQPDLVRLVRHQQGTPVMAAAGGMDARHWDKVVDARRRAATRGTSRRARELASLTVHPVDGGADEVAVALVAAGGIGELAPDRRTSGALCGAAIRLLGAAGMTPGYLSWQLAQRNLTIEFRVTGSSTVLTASGPRAALDEMLLLVALFSEQDINPAATRFVDFIGRQQAESDRLRARPEAVADAVSARLIHGDEAVLVPIPASRLRDLRFGALRSACARQRGRLLRNGHLIVAGHALDRGSLAPRIAQLFGPVRPRRGAVRAPTPAAPLHRLPVNAEQVRAAYEGIAMVLPLPGVTRVASQQQAQLFADLVRRRLERSLRLEQALAYSVSVTLAPQQERPDEMRLKIWVPSPAHLHARLVALVKSTLAEVVSTPVRDEDLSRFAAQIDGSGQRLSNDPQFAVRRYLAGFEYSGQPDASLPPAPTNADMAQFFLRHVDLDVGVWLDFVVPK